MSSIMKLTLDGYLEPDRIAQIRRMAALYHSAPPDTATIAEVRALSDRAISRRRMRQAAAALRAKAANDNHDFREIAARHLKPLEIRLRRCWTTLQRLPDQNVRPAGVKSAWPTIIRDQIEAYARDDVRMPRLVPSAADIQEMDTLLGWMLLIGPRERQLLQLRALGMSYRALAQEIGCSHEAARRDCLAALAEFAIAISRKQRLSA